MYYLILFLLGLGGILLQSTVFTHLTVAGVKPDLLLVLVIFNSIFKGPLKGTVFAFFLGWLEDFFIGGFWGMNALAKALMAFLWGWFMQGTFRDNLFVPVFSLFLGSLFHGAVLLVLGNIAGLNWSWSLLFWKVLPGAIYNTCLVPFLYFAFYNWVTKQLEQQQQTF